MCMNIGNGPSPKCKNPKSQTDLILVKFENGDNAVVQGLHAVERIIEKKSMGG